MPRKKHPETIDDSRKINAERAHNLLLFRDSIMLAAEKVLVEMIGNGSDGAVASFEMKSGRKAAFALVVGDEITASLEQHISTATRKKAHKANE